MRLDLDQLPLTGWYPGHMLKAGRQMQEQLRLVDAVIELLDARVPLSSRNPVFRTILGDKPRFLLFNKADLVPDTYAAKWTRCFADNGESAAFVDALHDHRITRLLSTWEKLVKDVRRERGATRPLLRPARLMIIGIPNVGKSTVVNRLLVSKRAAVGPRPGVTRAQQWIRLKNGMELLDTPGVLWPKIPDKRTELKLALVGSIKDELVGCELLAEFLWEQLRREKSGVDWSLYGLDACTETPEEFLDAVGRRRGLLGAGGQADRLQSAVVLLRDYREGKLARFGLDAMQSSRG